MWSVGISIIQIQAGFIKALRRVMAHGTLYVTIVANIYTRQIMTKNYLRPFIKFPKEKKQITKWILDNFPENYQELSYCEPFCGGSPVYLNKDPSFEELISDVDCQLINIYKALRDEPKEFIGKIKRTKYTELSFNKAYRAAQSRIPDYVENGINEYILRKMSRGGLKKTFFKSTEEEWQESIKDLMPISKRIKDTNIICKCFKEIFKIWDEENTLIYLDPPELPCKGEPEPPDMTIDDHVALLNMVKWTRGKIIIKGHPCPLYNKQLSGWRCVKLAIASSKKVDVLWMNYDKAAT